MARGDSEKEGEGGWGEEGGERGDGEKRVVR